MKIKELAAHLLNFDPQREPARLALYHYLKNFRHLDEELTDRTIESFYHRAMQFDFWQGAVAELGRLVSGDLNRIFERYGIAEKFRNVKHSHETHWMTLKFDSDFQGALRAENDVLARAGESIKVIALDSGEVLRLRRDPSKGIVRAEVKTRKAYLDQGQVRLLGPTTELVYGEDLELLAGAIQIIQLNSMKTARFYRDGVDVVGLYLQGYSFSKTDTVRGQFNSLRGPFDKLSEIFWAVKSLEKHFINPVTDEHYLSVIGDLENAIHAIKTAHPNRVLVAGEALQTAELYQEKVLPNDRPLSALISTLKYHLQQDPPVFPGSNSRRTESQIRSHVETAVKSAVQRPEPRVNWLK